MASVNKVIIVGNVGRDPETRTFPSGDMVCNISVATTEKWKDKQTGEAKEATEWHRIVFNGKLAEIANQYVRKGTALYVEGSLKTRKWTDQAGVEKYATEIRATSMQLLGGKQDGGQAPAPAPRAAAPAGRAPAAAPQQGDNMDDVPF